MQDGPNRRPAQVLGGAGVGDGAAAEASGGGGAGDRPVTSVYVPDPIDVCPNLVGESRKYLCRGEPATPDPVFPWHKETIDEAGKEREMAHVVFCAWESDLFFASPYPNSRLMLLVTAAYVELRVRLSSGTAPSGFYRIATADFKPQGPNALSFHTSNGLFGWPNIWHVDAVLEEKPLSYALGGAGVGGSPAAAQVLGGGVGGGPPPAIAAQVLGGAGVGGAAIAAQVLGGGGVGDGGWDPPPTPVSTGLTLPGVGQVYTPPSEVPWSSPNNVTTLGAPLSGTSMNGSSPSFDQSHLLVARDFGFAIPGGATIVGVEAELLGHWQFAAANVALCQLFAGGVVVGSDNKASASGAFPLGSPAAAVAFGGPADLWGATLTPAVVNDPGFGVAFAVDAVGLPGSRLFYMYTMRLNVHYTV